MATQSLATWIKASTRDTQPAQDFIDGGRRDAADDARRRLAGDRRGELRGVSCHAAGGVVVLSGQVRTYYLKQLAQEIVRKIDGIAAIENRLEVTSQPLAVESVA